MGVRCRQVRKYQMLRQQNPCRRQVELRKKLVVRQRPSRARLRQPRWVVVGAHRNAFYPVFPVPLFVVG